MKNNKGFSLVELIIVIAIMAILVGVMAPQLIKYIGKTKVEADREMINAIYTAIVYAMSDPQVTMDPVSEAYIAGLTSPKDISTISSAPILYNEVLDTLGWTTTQYTNYMDVLSSAHDSSQSTIFMQFKGTCDNPLAMWINHTDSSGNKDTSITVSSYSDPNISKVVSIY